MKDICQSEAEAHPAEALVKMILKIYPDFDLALMIQERDDRGRRLLSVQETLNYLGRISKMTLWRLVNEEKSLTPVYIGRRPFFDRIDLDRFVKRNKNRRNDS